MSEENEIAVEVSAKGKFVVCDDVAEGAVLDDIVIRTSNGNTVSLRSLLKEIGEL